ncbi:MAG TPA: ABC-type transport auxiliary lipoprotein family protein [Stellaceae bacterium]|jgi:cholesterol transport system auxiliary component
MSTLLHRSAALALSALTLLTLAGCGGLLSNPETRRLYQVTSVSSFASGLPHSAAQLAIGPVEAPAGLDTNRIALSRAPLSLDYYAEVSWSDRAPAMVRTALLESMQNSGLFRSVGSDTFNLRTDYLLKTELRSFEAIYDSQGPGPTVTVVLGLTLVKLPGDAVVGQTVIRERQPAASNEIPEVVRAYNTALGKTLQQAVAWTADHATLSPTRR